MPRAPLYRLPNVSGIAQPLPSPLQNGAVLENGETYDAKVSIAGLERFRIYWLSSCDGTLSVAFYRAGATDTVHTAGAPASVPVTAGTEVKIDVNPHFGEHAARVRFVASGDGAVTFAESCGVAPARR